tara:strand:- start:26198 stop:27277 length:1080 start_codon:yes stop_codon:yes gene_type:complete
MPARQNNKYITAFNYVLSATRRHHLNPFRAFADFFNFAVLKKFSPVEIYNFDLLSPQWTKQDRKELVSKEIHLRNQQEVNPAAYSILTEDKVVFHYYCSAASLATPRLLAVVNRFGASFASDHSPITCFEDFRAALTQTGTGVICKPVYGAHGTGIVGFDKKNEAYEGIRSEFPSLESFYNYLTTTGRHEEFIIQEKLTGHQEILALTGKKQVQGLRLITVMDKNNEPRLILRKIKLAGRDRLLDNFQFGQSGALLCLLDENGQIEKAHAYCAEKQALTSISHHPETGKSLIGFQVPHWKQCVDLVLRAQKHFRPHKTIGWDVAITDEGPLLLEGNIYWDPLMPIEGPMKSLCRKYSIG